MSFKIDLKICSLNINKGLSIKCQNPDFVNLVKKFDLICIQESWLTDSQTIDIQDYQYFRSDRHKGKVLKKGGGVVLFFKKEFKKGLTKIKSKNPDNMWIKLNSNFFGLKNDTYLLCSYIPPRDSKIHKDYDIFNNIDIEISSFSHRGDIIIMGDLNSRVASLNESYVLDVLDNAVPYIENLDPRTSKDKKVNTFGKKLMAVINSHHLTIVNGRLLGDFDGNFTCFQTNGCSVVDYCIVSNSLYKCINYFKVEDLVYYSDHSPITLNLKCNMFQVKHQKFTGKKIDKFKWNEQDRINFCTVLQSEDCSDKLKTLIQNMKKNPRYAVKEFEKFVLDIANKTLKKAKIVPKKSSKIQFTAECHTLRTNFKKSLRIFKNNKKQDNNQRIDMLIAQKKYRKAINMQKRIKKENDINSLKKMEKSDPKLFWQSVKKLINNQKIDECENITDQKWVDYFHNLYNKQNNNSKQFKEYISESLKTLEKQPVNLNVNQVILNGNITRDEIVKNIKSLKNGKSVGLDMISGEILKCCIEDDNMIDCLQTLFSTIFDSGNYPEQWDCSLITPIHKTGPTDNPNNYRGIAVSSSISKIYNKILANRLDEYMNQNNLWSNLQGGFKKKIRTEDNIMVLKTIITEISEIQNGTLFTCFVDFSKFFDTINRNMMFYKMIKLGITGNIYKSIKSMYKNCNYAIKINNMASKTFSSNTGVKQGCTLSPLLSNLYQNDLHDIFDDTCFPVKLGNMNINSLSWADDLVLFSTNKKGIQNCMDKLSKYCHKWDLTINSDKTKYMTIGKPQNFDLKFQGVSIAKVTEYKYLGVIIHKSGKIKYAIEDRIKKSNRAINMLRGALCTTSNVSVDIALSLFDKQIFPILSYGSIFWGINNTYNKLYIDDIPKNVTSIKQLTIYLNIQENSITKMRKINSNGKTNKLRMLVTTKDYISKLNLLNNKTLKTGNFTNSYDDHPLEKVHTKFIKYTLGLNKFASNHAIRAEVGRYPLELKIYEKLIKYWHRMENFSYENYPILAEAFSVSKQNKHAWHNEIMNFMQSNGLGFMSANPTHFDENRIIHDLNTRYKDQYVQAWDAKARESKKLSLLYKLKCKSYKSSTYLSDLCNIEDRIFITKIRTACSKLKSHRFLGKNESILCPLCNLENDTPEHLFFGCEHYEIKQMRNKHLALLCNCYPEFKHLSLESKLYSVLNLKPFHNTITSLIEYRSVCVQFLREMFVLRFSDFLMRHNSKKLVTCTFR